MLKIIVHDGSGNKNELSFDKTSIMIGKAPGNDIVLSNESVSRFHSRITVDEETIEIEDVGSTNGTYVNAKRIQKQVVTAKDKITIGTVLITCNLVATEGLEQNSTAETQGERQPLAAQVLTREETAAEKPSAVVEKPAQTSDQFFMQSLRSFFGPLWDYITDDNTSELMINGPKDIYIESKGRLQKLDAEISPSQLDALVINVSQYVGRRISEEEPYLDARLPDGSRVAVLMPPCSRKGTAVAIRKFSKEKLTLQKLFEFGSLSQEMIVFLEAAVLLKKNIIVSGGTSSGKTSLLNVISGLIPTDERILTIEDAAELQLSQDHVLPMETRPPDKRGKGQITIRDLVKVSLRMRPDRIVVGEIRGGEALDLLQAMNTGHSGSMATVHASSPDQAMTRLETLALFSGVEIPLRALREQVSTAINIVVQASRLPDHSRKVTHISEVLPLDDQGRYNVQDLFVFEHTGRDQSGKISGKHIVTDNKPSFLDEMKLSGCKEALALYE
ncbi:Flp pilus assembly complex ATPase component TadA [bacterium]|nr:Flp pilus assembly complex ATPase component TadA [bacterium]